MSKKTMITACFALVLLGIIGGLLYAAISGEAGVAAFTLVVGCSIVAYLMEQREDLDDE